MPCHVGQAERQLTHVQVGGQIVLRRDNALHDFGGNRLAGLVVHGPQVEEFLLGSPVLHDLRRKLHEVAVNARAGLRLVFALAQHAVQGVSELVEESLQLVERQQRRRGLGGFGEIHHQRHQRTGLLAVLDLRAAEFGHPRTRTLRLAGEEVEVEHGHKAAVLVGYVIGRHVGMIDLDLVVGREIQAVKLVGEHEHALLDVFELQIGLHDLVVERIFLVLVFFVVIAPVPRHQLALEAQRSGIVADHPVILVGIGFGLAEQLVEECRDGRSILGHAAFEHVIRVALVTQQVGDLQAQVGDLLHDLRVVVLAAQRTRIVGAPELLLQGAVRRIGHERHIARRLQRHGPTLLAARLGVGGHTLPDECGQFGNDLRIGNVDRKGVGCGQRVLAELQGRGRQLGGILAVKLLIGVRKGGAVAGEALVGVFQQFPVLFRKTAAGFLVNRLHAGEKLRIERNVVRQLGELGLNAQRDLLHLVRGRGFEQVVENTRNAVEQRPLTLQRHDGVAEGRLLGVIDDRLDLGARAGDGRIERRLVIRKLDLRERRRLVGRVPLRQQGVGGIQFGQLRFGNRIVGAACRHS